MYIALMYDVGQYYIIRANFFCFVLVMKERVILKRAVLWLSLRREERLWTMSTATVRRQGDPPYLPATRMKRILTLSSSESSPLCEHHRDVLE